MSSDSIVEGLTAASLEAKWKSNFQWQTRNPFNNRIRRALSWLARAEREQERYDPDAAFIFYWIAFNAMYAVPRQGDDYSERDAFEDYFTKVVPLDKGDVVFNAVWMKHNREIRTLLANKFVFQPFWDDSRNWEQLFYDNQRDIDQEWTSRKTGAILVRMFDRLYVLRNQLLHGAATWRGGTNRAQVEDGAVIMALLVPHFTALMLDNPSENWGHPRYSPEWAWERLGIQHKA